LGFFYHCNFAEILFASMCLGKNYMMPFFASGHRLGQRSRIGVEKKNIWLTFLPYTAIPNVK